MLVDVDLEVPAAALYSGPAVVGVTGTTVGGAAVARFGPRPAHGRESNRFTCTLPSPDCTAVGPK